MRLHVDVNTKNRNNKMRRVGIVYPAKYSENTERLICGINSVKHCFASTSCVRLLLLSRRHKMIFSRRSKVE